MMGFMFRRVHSMQQLKQYHEAMSAAYLIQTLVTFPVEVSVFYYRFPNQRKGTITGFVRKEFMQVTGDGKSTLRDLIMNYSRARFRRKELLSKHESHLNRVLRAGETYVLSYALNLSRGGKLVSLRRQKDEQLLAVFDSISHFSRNFYYGRFDIGCASVEDLKRGKNFSILEYNGCGAEPHHVYGNGITFVRACLVLIQHWDILSRIAMQNYRQGVRRWKFWKGLRFMWNAHSHFRKLSKLDAGFEFRSTLPVETFASEMVNSPYGQEAWATQQKAS